jgi:hypothetical protein
VQTVSNEKGDKDAEGGQDADQCRGDAQGRCRVGLLG